MIVQYDINQGLPESMRAAWLQKQWIESRTEATDSGRDVGTGERDPNDTSLVRKRTGNWKN